MSRPGAERGAGAADTPTHGAFAQHESTARGARPPGFVAAPTEPDRRPRAADSPGAEPDSAPAPGAGRSARSGGFGAGYRRAVREGWWSREHGAWAVLLLPWGAGVLRSGFEPIHAVLLVAWIVGYLALGAATTWATAATRARRAAARPAPATAQGHPRPGRSSTRPPARPRGRSAALTYGTVAGLALLGALIQRPDLWRWAPFYLVIGALTWRFTRTNRARTITADAAVMLAAAAFTLVVYQAGNPPGGTIASGWFSAEVLALVVFAYLFGCALHVKALIRERGSRAHAAGAVGFHAVCAAVLFAVAQAPHRVPGLTHRALLACAVLFALLTVRTVVLLAVSAARTRRARAGGGGRPLSPGVVGGLELLPCVALLFVAAHWV